MTEYIALSFSEARSVIEKKLKHTRYQKIDAFSFSEEVVTTLLASQSLFDSEVIVFADILTKERLAFLKPLILASTHQIFFTEANDFKWKQDFIKSIKGEVIKVPGAKSATTAPRAKSYAFDVGNALLAKDKKAAWIWYQKALQNDEDPNAIHSAVWWVIKQLVVPNSRYAKYQKSYTPQGVSALSTWWIGLLHATRKDNVDVSLAIEKAILEM